MASTPQPLPYEILLMPEWEACIQSGQSDDDDDRGGGDSKRQGSPTDSAVADGDRGKRGAGPPSPSLQPEMMMQKRERQIDDEEEEEDQPAARIHKPTALRGSVGK